MFVLYTVHIFLLLFSKKFLLIHSKKSNFKDPIVTQYKLRLLSSIYKSLTYQRSLEMEEKSSKQIIDFE